MNANFDLVPGDVLSYSAGSTQTGPLGYRKQRERPSMLLSALRRWPELAVMLGESTPLFINAYPATIGRPSAVVSVDTYLSPRVLSRALQLGALHRSPTILAGQSLFLADALLEHVDAARPLPRSLLLVMGGYVTPRSLERLLVELLAAQVERLVVLHGYGVAEVDAGCMVARERDGAGQLVYLPREDVRPELDGDTLLLSASTAEGERMVERWPTGDHARRCGEGWVIWNDARLHPAVEAELESWRAGDWRRRTGYLRREGGRTWMQLRSGCTPQHEQELEHFEFGRKFGFSWLDKPIWS